MAKTRVLITVKAYPQPTVSYDELVCTAGFLESHEWIRIYPVPFEFMTYKKYDWVELELIKRSHNQDFRPESYQPKSFQLADLKVIDHIGTAQQWYERKQWCTRNTYTSMTELIAASQSPKNISLASFKPTELISLDVNLENREWKPEWLEKLKQVDLATGNRADKGQRVPIEKIPYRFKYTFLDADRRKSSMTIEDWEIGALYRNSLANAEGDEKIAIDKVRERYEKEFFEKKDITLFLGTTLTHHQKRHTNPFTIIGVFYPDRVGPQSQMFG